MDEAPREVAAGLTGLASVKPVWQLAERRMAAGDGRYVADLAIAMVERYGAAEVPPWQYRSAVDHLLRLLAASDVDETVRFAAAAGDGQSPYLASLLAAAHPVPELDAAFAGPVELRACLTQELVLRGQPVDRPMPAGHPLGVLPPTLVPPEAAPEPAMFGPWDLPSRRVGGDEPVELTETTTPAESVAMASAVRNWTAESNGRFEARSFRLAHDFDDALAVDTLLAVQLDCLDGLLPRRRLGLAGCTP